MYISHNSLQEYFPTHSKNSPAHTLLILKALYTTLRTAMLDTAFASLLLAFILLVPLAALKALLSSPLMAEFLDNICFMVFTYSSMVCCLGSCNEYAAVFFLMHFFARCTSLAAILEGVGQ